MFNDLLRNDGIRRGPFGSSLKKDIFVPDTKDSYAVYEQRNAINNSFKTRYFIDQSKYDELHNFHLHTNDIIMSGAGTIGKLAKVPTGFRKGVFNQALIRFRINDKVNVNYFLTFMNTPKMQRKLTEANPGSAMVNLVPMKELKKWQILIPQLEEQNKIEKLLTQVNKLLDLYQRKLDLLKQLKRGMLQKLFADNDSKQPELRFDEFNEDWEQRKLKKIAIINPKDSLPAKFNYVDLESVVGTNLEKYQLLTKTNAPSRAQRVAEYNDIFYQTVRPYQRNNFLFQVENSEYPFVFSTGYAQIRTNINASFLFTKLQTNNFVNTVLARCTGTSYPAINSNDLGKILIYYPSCMMEQDNIGKLFQTIDNLLTLYQSKIDTLTNLKKFLLQQIFI